MIMRRSTSAFYLIVVASVSHLAGCGGVSELTKENVNRAETAVLQAQQTLGGSEDGAVELQRARDHLEAAKGAVASGDEKPAATHAQQAHLDAELAVARAQSAVARRAVDEMHAGNKMLSEEAQRSATDLQ
jgi:hypothetical protein